METIFTLPLAILAAFQVLIALLLLSPVAAPLSVALSKAMKSTASRTTLNTVKVLLLGLFVSSMLELVKGADKVKRGDVRVDLIASIDYLRSQVSCCLCVLNLLLLLLSPALAEVKKQLDFQVKNLDAVKRQVKGLQAEYERVTSSAGTGPSGAGSSASGKDGSADKALIDRLTREKAEQQSLLAAAEKGKAAAEARVDAMLSQIKGFDKEYDRVLDENKILQRRLAQVDAGGLGQASFREVNKKDD